MQVAREQNFFQNGTFALMEESGEKSWYLQEQLGSVLHFVDREGKSRKAYVYDKFGMEQSGHNEESEVFQFFGYTGYQRETVLGQYYAQARSYDVGMDRFLSEDLKEGEKVFICTYHEVKRFSCSTKIL